MSSLACCWAHCYGFAAGKTQTLITERGLMGLCLPIGGASPERCKPVSCSPIIGAGTWLGQQSNLATPLRLAPIAR